MDYVLQTMGLSKHYGGKYALNNVSINIRKGDIYGIIGRNGAGKTTLIRLIAGLMRSDGGSLRLFESDDLSLQRSRMGTVIEYPSLYPNMSAEENLEFYRRLYGIDDEKAVGETLKTVGLSTGKKKTKNFSLGMKQRLGIAIAIMGNPDFLILDEPLNGLDPTGIKEIRELILSLNREQGITVLISSHILGELSKMATAYGILRDGSLIEEFTAEDLSSRCRRSLKIAVDNPEKASLILENDLGTTNFDVLPGGVIRLFDYIDRAGYVNRTLVNNDISVEMLCPVGQDLEGYFMERINGKGRG